MSTATSVSTSVPTRDAQAAGNARHVETILREIESLPTLPAIATRLLSLTADSETHLRQVVELITADPTLTAKVLSLCSRLGRGVNASTFTVERAVQLLGFNAIRTAVLSVSVFELYGPDTPTPPPDQTPTGDDDELGTFHLADFWWHSLAVAVAAEQLAHSRRQDPDVNADEAFVCGLLHDIGELALHHVLPQAMRRVIELTNLNQGNIAEFERRVIGLDHHTAGKRLAEQWRLPHLIQDCVWLHGSPFDMLPELEHRRMVGIVSLADALVRRHHIGYSGNHQTRTDISTLARELGVSDQTLEQVGLDLHERLEHHARALGLSEAPSPRLLLGSIQKANQELGRLNAALQRRTQAAARQGRLLEAIASFHNASEPCRNVEDVIERVASSAISALGPGPYAMLYEVEPRRQWLYAQYNAEGRHVRSETFAPPREAPALEQLDAAEPASLNAMSMLPWLADYLGEAFDVRTVRLLPLGCGWGTAAVLIHQCDALPPWRELTALTLTWGGAIAAAKQHAGARRLGEQLAESNRALAEAQDQLLQTQALAKLGEMAAGAAHEMNNPLAVISGRSQLLAQRLSSGSEEHRAAAVIAEQSHRLSDLISSLHLLAELPEPDRRHTDVRKLLETIVQQVRDALPPATEPPPISMQWRHDLPVVPIDPDLVGKAVKELLLNAVQAAPKSCVHLSARTDSRGRTLTIQVSDDGMGMAEHVLEHAMDPFFSSKPAGRRTGLGLPRAQQYAKAHGGTVDLRSAANSGTVATLTLPLDCEQ